MIILYFKRKLFKVESSENLADNDPFSYIIQSTCAYAVGGLVAREISIVVHLYIIPYTI